MQAKAVDHKQALSQFGFSLPPNRGHEINDKIHDASENQLCVELKAPRVELTFVGIRTSGGFEPLAFSALDRMNPRNLSLGGLFDSDKLPSARNIAPCTKLSGGI